MAYEVFDSEILHIIGNAMDEAWRRVKFNHLKGDANAVRSVLASHIFAMARQGERNPQRLIDGALSGLHSERSVAYRLKVPITSPVTMFSGPPRDFLSASGLPLSNLREIILRSMPQIIELRLSPLCKVEGPEGDFANSAAKSGF